MPKKYFPYHEKDGHKQPGVKRRGPGRPKAEPKWGYTSGGKPRTRPTARQMRERVEKAVGSSEPSKPNKKQPGKPGRKTISELAQSNLNLLDQYNFNPLLFLLQIANGDHEAIGVEKDELTLAVRQNAAKDMLPYVAPKLKALELSDPTGGNPLALLAAAVKASTDKANS